MQTFTRSRSWKIGFVHNRFVFSLRAFILITEQIPVKEEKFYGILTCTYRIIRCDNKIDIITFGELEYNFFFFFLCLPLFYSITS
jgi:hypothetical protein